MPIYEFKCTNRKCQTKLFELFQNMSEDHKADCPDCGNKAKRKYSFAAGIVTFREGWHDGLGEYVNTKRQEDTLLEKHGLSRKT